MAMQMMIMMAMFMMMVVTMMTPSCFSSDGDN
jgi:hypothetical protein